MRIKKSEADKIILAAKEIKRLATLETCGLKEITDNWQCRLWVQWFDAEANKILEVLEIDREEIK